MGAFRFKKRWTSFRLCKSARPWRWRTDFPRFATPTRLPFWIREGYRSWERTTSCWRKRACIPRELVMFVVGGVVGVGVGVGVDVRLLIKWCEIVVWGIRCVAVVHICLLQNRFYALMLTMLPSHRYGSGFCHHVFYRRGLFYPTEDCPMFYGSCLMTEPRHLDLRKGF